MKTCIVLRKVVYRPPETDVLRWGIVLCQNGGLTLLYVPRCDEEGSHKLAVCAENIHERLFEDVETSQFPLEDKDVGSIGTRLMALGEAISEAELEKLFRPEDLF